MRPPPFKKLGYTGVGGGPKGQGDTLVTLPETQIDVINIIKKSLHLMEGNKSDNLISRILSIGFFKPGIHCTVEQYQVG